MKLSKYKLIIWAMVSMAFTSCGDFLDHLPDERVDNLNEDQVVKLLSTAYTGGNYGWICEISSDNVIDINTPYYATQSNGDEIRVYYNLNSYGREDDEAFRFEPVKSSTNSDSPTSVWDGCYGAIATANHAIEHLNRLKAENGGEMTASMRAAYGEAYLCRSFHHFILVNVFSQAWKNVEASKADVGVPYIDWVNSELIMSAPRGTVADTYAKIEEDLERGLELVSDINYEYPKWHFNVNAAHAYAARFYLYKRDYAKVIEHANAVLGTDRTLLPQMLMDYSKFDDCTRSTDYAEIWQGPDQNNNLMLISTYSTQWRRSIGNRYAYAGRAMRDIQNHVGPNWRWYMMPAAGVSGGTFWDGNSDHGYASARIAERFQYSDKVAGIGYAHIIRREFTATELLLERAEAYLLGNKDVDNCVADLIAYEESRQSFSPENKKFYTSNNALTPLTHNIIKSYYTYDERVDEDKQNPNVCKSWDFTQNMSADFVVPKDLELYMNCINDMRRYETAYGGHRFFDMKRWGMEWSHTYGDANTQITITLKWDDPRRAIEAPQDVLAAGMESSYSKPQEVKPGNSSTQYMGVPEFRK